MLILIKPGKGPKMLKIYQKVLILRIYLKMIKKGQKALENGCFIKFLKNAQKMSKIGSK